MKILRGAVAGSLESSDAMVTVTPADTLSVEVDSIVIRQFGPAIEEAVRDVLKEQQVGAAKVRIQDRGALECTIRARVETAILRAGEADKS